MAPGRPQPRLSPGAPAPPRVQAPTSPGPSASFRLLSVPSPFPVLPPPVPAVALQALPWTLSSPSDSALPSLALRRVPCTLAACPGPWKPPPPPQVLPRPVSAPPSFTQHLRPLTCVLTAYPGSTLEPGRAPGGSGFLPGAPGLPLAPFASPTPLWNPWAAPLYLPKTLPGPPGPSLLSLEPWSSCWLFLESSLGPQASPPPSPAGSPGLLPALAPSLLCLHFAFTPLPLCSFSSVPAPSCRAPSLFFLSLWVSSAPFPSRCSSWPLSSSPSSQSLVDSPKHPGVGARQASAVGVRRLVLFSFC